MKILWLDCLGGLTVGVLVLATCSLLSLWENLPVGVVIAMGLANLLYGSYSLYVTTRKPRPLPLVSGLAVANMSWLLVCIAIAVIYWQRITGLGLLHVLGEGIYVAGLGVVQWQWRQKLSGTASP